MTMEVHPGSTNVTTYFKIAAGLTITDLDLQYTRSGAVAVAKVDATALAGAGDAHADNKAIYVDATSSPGLLRVDWPDAAFATGVKEVTLAVKDPAGETEMLRVKLTTAATSFVEDDVHLQMKTPDDGGLYRRLFGEIKTATGTGFEERTGVISGNITKAGNPTMGVVFTDMNDAGDDEYYGPELIGAVIVNDDASTATRKRNYVILGGYFITSGTITKVFGIAKKMGVVNGSSTAGGVEDAGFAGTDINEVTASEVTGWTFITHSLPGGDPDFGTSGNDLRIEIPIGMLNVQSQIDELGTGTGDWTATEKENIRQALGVDGTKTAGASPGDVQDVETTIGVSGVGLTDLGGMSTGMKAEVESEANDALVSNNLDHLMKVAAANTDIIDDSVIAQMSAKGGTADFDTFDNTTDSLEALRDNQSASMNPTVLQQTTIATLATQISFTLTAGSADNDAYNDGLAIITDSATSTQKAVGWISDYVGSTKTITLQFDPAVFTMAVGDTIDIIANKSVKPSTKGESILLSSGKASDFLKGIEPAGINIQFKKIITKPFPLRFPGPTGRGLLEAAKPGEEEPLLEPEF